MITRSQRGRAEATEMPVTPNVEADKGSSKGTKSDSSTARKRRKVVVERDGPAVAQQSISEDDDMSLANLPDRTKEDVMLKTGFNAVVERIRNDRQDQTTAADNAEAFEEGHQSA